MANALKIMMKKKGKEEKWQLLEYDGNEDLDRIIFTGPKLKCIQEHQKIRTKYPYRSYKVVPAGDHKSLEGIHYISWEAEKRLRDKEESDSVHHALTGDWSHEDQMSDVAQYYEFRVQTFMEQQRLEDDSE